MMVIVKAQSPLGKAVVRKLNEHNFNYLVLADDSPSQTQWLEEVTFWHQIRSSELVTWINSNAEEIEFIVDCTTIGDRNSSNLFLALWRIGYQHQIPIIGLSESKEVAETIADQDRTPWFWTILLAENHNAETQSKMIADTIYHLIRNRQNSGIRTIDEIVI